MFLGLSRQRTDRYPAHHHRDVSGAIIIGDPPRFFQLRRERAEGDQVEMFGQAIPGPHLIDFVILDREAGWREPGQGQQSEARQRGDDAVALNEPGQCQAEFREFLVVCAHTAHGDESNPFHNLMTSHSVNVPPVIRLTTGIRNSARNRGRCARTKQQMGIVTAPRTNPHDATVTGIEA